MPVVYTQPETINSGDTIQLPDGDLYLEQPIVIINKEKIRIRGGKNTRLLYKGPPAIGAIQLHGVRKGSIGGRCGGGFEILALTNECEAAVLITNSNIPGFISSAIHVEDVHIRHGGHPTCFKKGFSVDSYAGDPLKVKGGTNNENHNFFNCTTESVSVAGFHVKGHQAHDITFERCAGYDAVGRRPYGVWCEEGSFIKWKNGSAFATRSDFHFCWPSTFVSIDGHNSEHSWRFVTQVERNEDGVITRAGTSSRFFVNIKNVRWDGEPIKGNAHPIIDLWGRGPLLLESVYLCGIKGIPPRIEMGNYSQIINGQWVPLLGTTSFNSVAMRQHGGRVETTVPLIKTPHNWSNQAFAVEHEYINADGSVKYRPIEINKPLVY